MSIFILTLESFIREDNLFFNNHDENKLNSSKITILISNFSKTIVKASLIFIAILLLS